MSTRRLLPAFVPILVLLAAACAHTGPAAVTPPTDSPVALLERQTLGLAPRAVAATVGLSGGMGAGSGVIISSDGLILTAAHVMNMGNLGDKPLPRMRVALCDGRRAYAVPLGIDHEGDIGLMRIEGPAPEGGWPFAETAPSDTLAPGDWVAATGHRMGFNPKRSAPLRVGRVIGADQHHVQTDCTMNSGDSGGPTFDLKGRVVGIHSNGGQGIHENGDAPIRIFNEFREAFVAGGKVVSGADVLGYRELSVRWNAKVDNGGDAPPGPLNDLGEQTGDASPEAVALIMPALKAGGDCCVRILARETSKPLALGTVWSADGLILTKASLVQNMAVSPVTPKVIDVQAADGRRLPATLLAQDAATDLALLQVGAGPWTPARWATAPAVVGAWIAVPQTDAAKPALGVVSVADRAIAKRDPSSVGPAREPVSQTGRLSRRASDFPLALQHDAVVPPGECGGPVVGMRGEVLGVNIARFDRIGTYAIPAAEAAAAVARMQAPVPAK